MAEELELGRITRPAADNYRGKRKLLLAPLAQLPGPAEQLPADGVEVVGRYWEQVDTQVRAVQNALGSVTRVYHESLPEGGAAGLGYLEAMGPPSRPLVSGLVAAGAALESLESFELLAETMDWQRCLMMPLLSPAAAGRLQEWLADANRRRYQAMAEAIDATLGADETGLLLVNERHQIQFPGDVEVIYIAPPALDELRRWVQNWGERMAAGDAGDGDGGSETDYPDAGSNRDSGGVGSGDVPEDGGEPA